MSDRPVIVEFLGLSGAGKSTVSHRVAEQLRGRGLPVREPTLTLTQKPGRGAIKSLYVARELILHPLSSLRTLKSMSATRQRLPVLFRMGFNWLMLSSLMRTHRSSLQLFDQGTFQALWSIGLEARRGTIRDVGRQLVDMIRIPDVVVVIEAGANVVSHRLKVRGGHESRADLWDSAALNRSLRTMDEVKSILQASSARPGGPRILFATNGPHDDVEAVADRLAVEIERLAKNCIRARRHRLPKAKPLRNKTGVAHLRLRKLQDRTPTAAAIEPSPLSPRPSRATSTPKDRSNT
jgi:hypothetical protein